MINFDVGDLVWILEDSLGHAEQDQNPIIPRYKTKKPSYGIVIKEKEHPNGFVTVSFWEETNKSFLFKEKNLRKQDMEVDNDKTCRSC